MNSETYLLIANIAVWVVIAGYLGFVAAKGASMERRIRQMELIEDDK